MVYLQALGELRLGGSAAVSEDMTADVHVVEAPSAESGGEPRNDSNMGKLGIILKSKNSTFQKDSLRRIMSRCVCETWVFRGSLRRRGRQRLEGACRVNIRSPRFITIAQPQLLPIQSIIPTSTLLRIEKNEELSKLNMAKFNSSCSLYSPDLSPSGFLFLKHFPLQSQVPACSHKSSQRSAFSNKFQDSIR